MMKSSVSSIIEGYSSGQGVTPNNFESRPDVEPTYSLNQYHSSNLFYPCYQNTGPMHRAFSSENTQEYYAHFHQQPIANEPVVGTAHQPRMAVNRQAVSAEDHVVSEATIQPLGNRVPPRQPTHPHHWNSDIRNHNEQTHLPFHDYDHWPDGNTQRVYSAALKRVKRHQSGWAMRNSNNHNPAILKKSCLGVLACSNGCVNEDGREICYRPAICDKARRKQCCCRGQIIQRPCRGNDGYPVTHFWHQEGGIMFFRSKGRHDHPRPTIKLPSASIIGWHRGLPETRTFNSLTPPAAARTSMEPQAKSVGSNLDVSPTNHNRFIDPILYREPQFPPSPFGQREIRPSVTVYRHTTVDERQQINLPSGSSTVAFATGLLRDTSSSRAATPLTEPALYAPQQESNFHWAQPLERSGFISVPNELQHFEPSQIEANNPVSMQYTPDHLQSFFLQYDNRGIGGAPFASSSVGVVEQKCLVELNSVVQSNEHSRHLVVSNSNSSRPFHSPLCASSIMPQFGTPSRSVDLVISRARSAFQPYVTRHQLQLRGPAQMQNYQPWIPQ